MQYIVHKRFRADAICGRVNIPAMTVLSAEDKMIMYNGEPVCMATSENAHQYFSRNDDGNGILRGNLTQAIQKILSKRDENYQIRWDSVWNDYRCQKYKRPEYEDYWLWNHKFFNADINDLLYIAALVGVNRKGLAPCTKLSVPTVL